jgi:hypothetical protein
LDSYIKNWLTNNSRAVANLGFLPYAVGTEVANALLFLSLKLKEDKSPFDGAIGMTLNEFTDPGAPTMHSNMFTTQPGGVFNTLHMGQTKITPS